MVVCGGIANMMKIITKPVIVLSLGIETSVEDFFDPHYLMRNLASLFGIPSFRLRIPKIVPGSALLDVEIGEVDACDVSLVPTCGAHGRCYLGECDCDDGWRTPADCGDGGDCSCSEPICAAGCASCDPAAPDVCTACPLPGGGNATNASAADGSILLLQNGSCVEDCGPGEYAAPGAVCAPCDASCATCDQFATTCTSCAPLPAAGVAASGAPLAWLSGASCVSECPAKTYAEVVGGVRRCLPCHSTCSSCEGPRASQCSACTAHKCTATGLCRRRSGLL